MTARIIFSVRASCVHYVPTQLQCIFYVLVSLFSTRSLVDANIALVYQRSVFFFLFGFIFAPPHRVLWIRTRSAGVPCRSWSGPWCTLSRPRRTWSCLGRVLGAHSAYEPIRHTRVGTIQQLDHIDNFARTLVEMTSRTNLVQKLRDFCQTQEGGSSIDLRRFQI